MKKCFFLILFLFSNLAWAVSSLNVPVDDPAYRQIDVLVSQGLVKTIVYGQRPWSRQAIVTMALEAHKILNEKCPEGNCRPYRHAGEIIEHLKKRFQPPPLSLVAPL